MLFSTPILEGVAGREVATGESAAEAAAALDVAESARDVHQLDDALRLWAAVTGRGGAALYLSSHGHGGGHDSSSRRLPNIVAARRTASAPDGVDRVTNLPFLLV
jgi:hypothetical protein